MEQLEKEIPKKVFNTISVASEGNIMDQKEKEMSEEIFNTLSIVLAEQGEVAPLYFIVKDKVMDPIVGHPGVTHQHLASITVNMAHETNADAVVLVCEQWMVKLKKDTKDAQDYIDGTKRPSQSPDAEPYLTLTYMTKNGEASSLIGKVHTSPNGVRFIRETEWISETTTNMIVPWGINDGNDVSRI